MLYVVVPAYNEAENLAELIPRIHKHVVDIDEGARILVVNDGSTDDTKAVMADLSERIDGVSVMSSARNRGKAAGLKSGFEVALDGGATEIVMMDADGQDDPAEMSRLLDQLREGSDLVTGARLQRHDRFVKRHTSRLYNRVTGLLSGAPGRDFNSGFKVMRAEVARDVSPMLYGELHRYLTVMSFWLGYRVAEVPVQHHERMYGVSKYGLARFWRGFADLLTVRFLMSYEHRPSHLFGGIGLTSFLLGSATLGYLTVLKVTGHPIGDRPLLIAGVLFALVGLQLILFGLLAELIVYVRSAGGERRD
jgi:glycosyltransferase involved in cell wall biosynthesis